VNSTTVLIPPGAFLEVSNTAPGIEFTLLGQAGQNYGIQVSTNLVTWTTIYTNTANLSGTFTFTDSSTNAPNRFYRTIRLAQ
jgi:hypothetical protein